MKNLLLEIKRYFLRAGKVATLEDQTLLWQASDLKYSRKIIF